MMENYCKLINALMNVMMDIINKIINAFLNAKIMNFMNMVIVSANVNFPIRDKKIFA